MRDREDLIQHFKKKGIGVEIGVFFGDFSKQILQRWDGKLYLIDIWGMTDDTYIDMSNHNHFQQDFPILKTLENIREYEEEILFLKN